MQNITKTCGNQSCLDTDLNLIRKNIIKDRI